MLTHNLTEFQLISIVDMSANDHFVVNSDSIMSVQWSGMLQIISNCLFALCVSVGDKLVDSTLVRPANLVLSPRPGLFAPNYLTHMTQ